MVENFLLAEPSGNNSITGKEVTITAKSGADIAHTMSASTYGSNTVIGDVVKINADTKSVMQSGYGKSAAGVIASGGGTNTINAATSLDIHASNTGNYAYGLHVGKDSTNTIHAENAAVHIHATSVSGNAYGVHAPAGKNIIAAKTLDIEAKSTNGRAYGITNDTGGTNEITIGKSLTVTANGNSIPLSGSDMYTHTTGIFASDGTNTIKAAANSTGIEIRITVTAGAGQIAYAMYARGNGTNLIEGSKEADYINLKGDIAVAGNGRNIINTGAGNDQVVLDGKVTNLTLKMGAGYDVLTLKAANFTEFETRYGAWLKAIASTPDFGVESIQIAGGWANWSDNDKTKLLIYFNENAFADIEDKPTQEQPIAVVEELSNTNVVHTTTSHVDMQGDHDGTNNNGVNSSHEFASTGNDMVRVDGSVSHTDFSFNGGGHDTLSISQELSASNVTTYPSYNGTLHVEAAGLDSSNLQLLGGTNDVHLHGNVDAESSIVLGAGNDTMIIEGDFAGYASMKEGDDSLIIHGDFTGNVEMGAGNDYAQLHGSSHGGTVDGGAGNDTIVGDAGDNNIIGGAGDDILTGGAGADTFVWNYGDQGTTGAPSTDVIKDFSLADGDKLDLNSLLGDATKDNLDNYLNIERAENNNVKLNINTGGSADTTVDQVIILEGTTDTNDAIMQHLIANLS